MDGGVKKKRKKKDKKKDKSSKSEKKDKRGDARGTIASEKAAGGGAAPPTSKWKHGDWSCQKCGAHNFRGKDSCFRCKYARANSVKAASAESALAYLTARRAGATEMDSVQHLWLGKSAYNRDVNDATFDLYLAYADGLENKHKLQILKPQWQRFQARQSLTALNQGAHRIVVAAGVLHRQHRPALGHQSLRQPVHLLSGAPQPMAEQNPAL